MCMRKLISHFLIISISQLLIACYNHGQQTPDAWDLSKQQLDSISFSTTHHYSQNYNFQVRSKLLPLADNLGDMAFDTMYVTKGQRIVVADIRTVPADSHAIRLHRDGFARASCWSPCRLMTLSRSLSMFSLTLTCWYSWPYVSWSVGLMPCESCYVVRLTSYISMTSTLSILRYYVS